MTSSFVERSLKDIAISDARTVGILERFGLDYCCGGNQTLERAAAARHIPLEPIVTALEALGDRDAGAGPSSWPDLDALTRHIVQRHHKYVAESAPAIQAWLDKLVTRHGSQHSELADVRDTFRLLAFELTSHMAKEETLLFPAIDELAVARRSGTRVPAGPFSTILHPVRVMEADHKDAGDLLARLRSLTRDYTVPDDGCTTYRLCYAELAKFEADLHQHVHLENNILFPGALELEQQLA